MKTILKISVFILYLYPQIGCTNDIQKETLTPQISKHLLEKHSPGFASFEHRNLGDLIQIHLPKNKTVHGAVYLNLPNGIVLTYGEIVMYAGDYFGDSSKTISDCVESKRQKCFQAQFEALASKGTANDKSCSNPIVQEQKIHNYLASFEENLKAARAKGIKDWDFYAQHSLEFTKKMNTITCGGSPVTSLFPLGNYLRLAIVNYDHFVPDSLIAYKAGHEYALKTAIEAHEELVKGNANRAYELLELAYAENAYANHFLSDSFASGHMRTPRRAMSQYLFIPNLFNLLLANLMHDEDNKNGLMVTNAEGTSFIAYGDNYLFKDDADLQRKVIIDAMQRSADGIYQSYLDGHMPKEFPEMRLLPNYEQIQALNTSSPLFQVEHKSILRRNNTNDIYDFSWTENWSVLHTLLDFNYSSKQ